MSKADAQPWSREYAACRGYGDAFNPQPCGSPALPHAGNGRCARCYQLHRRHTGGGREIAPSINDLTAYGEETIVATPSGARRVDPDLRRTYDTLNGATSAPTPTALVRPPATPATATPATATPAASDEWGFEVYTGSALPRNARPAITLRRDDGLYLNGVAYAALGNPTHVELLYSRSRLILALRPVDAAAEHARPVRLLKDKTVRYRVALYGLFAHYGGVAPCLKRYPVETFGEVQGIRLERATQEGDEGSR